MATQTSKHSHHQMHNRGLVARERRVAPGVGLELQAPVQSL